MSQRPDDANPNPPQQTDAERRKLMDEQRDHDERVYGVRPELVLDATADNADWLRLARFDPEAEDEPDGANDPNGPTDGTEG